jgi:peptidoglycan/xylan/chitin deacetylase (PgdA/CDA1 family)
VTCVALTFDDGPSEFTAGILDELDRRGALATFFAMGEKAAPYREILTRMTAEGHEVGNHTWNHPHLPTLLPAQITAQIADSSRALADASGQPMRMFRPPYGEFNPSVLQAAGLPAILWDVDTLDWQGPADDVLLSRAVDQPGPGSIVLMHDLQPGTARNAGAIIDGLLDRGFTLVTVEQLFDGVLPSSGAWRHGP